MDNNRAQLFLQKLTELRDEVQFYLGSDLCVDNIKEFSQKYSVNKEIAYFLLEEAVINDFNFAQVEAMLSGYSELANIDKKAFFRNLIGYLFSPIADFVDKTNIKKELNKRGGILDDYDQYIEKFLDALEDETLHALEELVNEKMEKTDTLSESQEAMRLFTFGLVDILRSDVYEPILSLNGGLIFLLFNKENFREDLSKKLLENTQILTNGKITLDNRKVDPIIANWLKDFIKYHGSGNFDNLALSKYLSTSENVKTLTNQDKELVNRLLKLYGNLKFFPLNQQNLPAEEWQIIPIDMKRLEEEIRARGGKTSKELKAEPVDEGVRVYEALDTLERIKKKYPKDSIEQKAIDEEMRKVRGKK